MKLVTIHSRYGPGGRHCPCCGPNPKHRKAHDRVVEKRIRRDAKKQVTQLLQEQL